MSESLERVSVIIPTYRRRSYLQRVMEGLARQTVQPFEVFVIDSSPEQEQLTAEEEAAIGPWLHYIRWPERGNISRQRNSALSRCRGDVVLFLDDDVEFGPDLIEQHLLALRHTGAAGVSGVILLENQGLTAAPRTRFAHRIADPGAPNYQAYDGIVDTFVICSANFSVRRHVVIAAGGFDEQIHGTFDDVEFGVRAARQGYRFVHHNGPKVLHLRAPASGSRSAEFGKESGFEWAATNQFYYQFRHWPQRGRRGLLASALWSHCRPSRHWLEPEVIVHRVRALLTAYQTAARRAAEPPRLLHTR
jgi:GT2 family glycosyltransferase